MNDGEFKSMCDELEQLIKDLNELLKDEFNWNDYLKKQILKQMGGSR